MKNTFFLTNNNPRPNFSCRVVVPCSLSLFCLSREVTAFEIATNLFDSLFRASKIPTPVVTLYTKQQINDTKRFCCTDNGDVLGMDKTYNLGDFHVTDSI